MKFTSFISNLIQEIVYICYDENTKDAVVIDPGGNGKKIIKVLEEKELNLKAVLLTHAHFDHIGALPELMGKYDVKLASHKDEIPIISNSKMNFSRDYVKKPIEIIPDILFDEDKVYSFGSIDFFVYHTPGHTPGSCCYYDEKEKILFSGDTLFREEIGRCDLYLGDEDKIIKSIQEILFSLDDDVKVYPGHDMPTTIGHEKKYNPYAKIL